MGVRIAATNLLTAAGAVISSNSEAAGYPDDYLASSALFKKWRSATGTGDQWAKWDLGANKSMQVFAAVQAKIHTGGTLRFQAHTSDSWGAPTVNQLVTIPAVDFTGVLTVFLTASVSLRWVRFYFTNVGAVNEYVELGVGFAGTYLEPAFSMADDVAILLRDPSLQRYAVGGQRSSVRRAKYHEISGTFEIQTASARDDLRTIYNTDGTTEPLLFALDPASPGGMVFYGPCAMDWEADHKPGAIDIWDVPFVVRQDVP